MASIEISNVSSDNWTSGDTVTLRVTVDILSVEFGAGSVNELLSGSSVGEILCNDEAATDWAGGGERPEETDYLLAGGLESETTVTMWHPVFGFPFAVQWYTDYTVEVTATTGGTYQLCSVIEVDGTDVELDSYTITVIGADEPDEPAAPLPGAGIGEVTQAEAVPTGFWPPPIGPYDVGRPPTYDADLVWDENEWKTIDGVLVTAGGGRYQQQLIVVGKDCIYVEDIT